MQLAMGLLRPWTVLLLDEITVDLDLLSRARFLEFLKRETVERGATVVYATHILDNLAEWPSHLVHMHLGRVKEWGSVEYFREGRMREVARRQTGNSELGELVLEWLQEDLDERGPRVGLGGEGRTYESHDGKGGYGLETRAED